MGGPPPGHMAIGVILKPCGPLGGEGGLKILKNGPRYSSKLVHVGGGGGGQKCPKIGPHGLSMTPK